MTNHFLFDIEGTIGDILFVRNVLFPFARKRIAQHFAQHWMDSSLQSIVSEARAASEMPLLTPGEATLQFQTWIDEDRKITPLKTLQGILWKEGYASGELKAHLYPDAVALFQRLRAEHKKLYIYSSGSIAAQKLYLQYSVAGDLTGNFSGYFDTTTGAKADPASYTRIAEAIPAMPSDITFFSDAIPEVRAAQSAGFRVFCVDRNKPEGSVTTADEYPVIGSFAALESL